MGEKRNVKNGEKMEKWICPFALFLHLCCFFDLLFCFYCAFAFFRAFVALFSSFKKVGKSCGLSEITLFFIYLLSGFNW